MIPVRADTWRPLPTRLPMLPGRLLLALLTITTFGWLSVAFAVLLLAASTREPPARRRTNHRAGIAMLLLGMLEGFHNIMPAAASLTLATLGLTVGLAALTAAIRTRTASRRHAP